MFRFRRYRSFIIFTAVFILAFFYFAGSSDWSPAVIEDPPKTVVDHPRPPLADGKDATPPPPFPSPPHPHGFIPETEVEKPESPDAPESKPEQAPADTKPEKPPLDTKPDSQDPPQGNTKQPVDAPAPSKPQVPSSGDNVPGSELKEGDPSSKDGGEPGSFASEFGAQGQGRLEVSLPETDLPAPHWKKFPENFPVAFEDIISLPTGRPKTFSKLQAKFKDESSTERLERLQKLDAIKKTFEHAWAGYKTQAMGRDELYPVKGGHRDPFNGWGATLVDSLDTLWIMDLKTEFAAAVDAVKKIDFTTSLRKDIPLFETVIRYLGGLLGAYDISGHRYTVLLNKAVELAEVLIGAFDTPNRMPVPFYHWAPDYVSQPHRSDVRIVLAELGSLSLEFTRLAQLTKQSKYYDAIARITNELEKLQNVTKLPGLWPLRIDASGCVKVKPQVGYGVPRDESPKPAQSSAAQPKPAPTDAESYKTFIERSGLLEDSQAANYSRVTDRVEPNKDVEARTPSEKNCKGGLNTPLTTPDTFSLGALADSTYEYLPKQYMLIGGLNEQYRTMYEKAMDTAREYLLFRPMVKDDRDLRFVASVSMSKPLDADGAKSMSYSYEGAHLTCFVGGMFAVGAKVFGIDADMDTAAKLTDGCVWAYESTRTGIMPERFILLPCENDKACPWDEARYKLALDPHRDQRISWAQEQQRRESPAQEKPEEIYQSVSTPSPSPQAHDNYKRDDALVSPAWSAEAIPTSTPTPKAENVDLTDRKVAVYDQAPVVSHDDYVDGRIKNERLPPGFINIQSYQYLLRPEAIESVFIMFRLTGDNSWREKGWKMFEAVSKYTRTELAHSAINDVTVEKPALQDEMESFWLAETLKYFYLLFSDPSLVSLDEYVLNTEAHPLKRPEY